MSDQPISILLIEDNRGDARLIREMMVDVGSEASLQVAERLSTGLERLDKGAPDLVLLDLGLPDSQGLDTLARVRAHAPEIPIVVMTGLDDEAVGIEAVKADAQDYLIKGQVDGRLLVRVIRYAIERKRAKEALRESEQKYRRLFQESRDAILIGARDGQTIDCNQAALDLFGCTREEFIKQHTKERYCNPADRERFFKEIEEKGYVKDFEVKLRKKDGTEMVCVNSATSWQTPDGRVLYWGIIRDITQQRRPEDEIRESEERFRQFFQNEPAYCYMISPQGVILDVNAAALEALGYDREELVGKPLKTIYAPESAQKMGELLAKWKETGSLEDEEIVIVTKDGERRTVLLSASAVRSEDGEILHSVSVQQDITERRRLEEQLRQAAKMDAIGRLAGGVAHDFLNQLTAVMGYSDLILGSMETDHPYRAYLEGINRAGQRSASLMRQLLAFSRRQVLEPTILDLNLVIQDMKKLLQSLLREDVEFVTCMAEDLGTIKADLSQIEQIIMNLVVNAREAMSTGDRLTIETGNAWLDAEFCQLHPGAAPGAFVMLSVNDTGCGMSEEVRSHIFEPFFTTKEEGTGLGLATVYGIVKQHQGNIWCYSEEGKGTTFRVYLPRVEEPAPGVPASVSEEIPRGSETILVVEDDDQVRTVTTRMLEAQGYNVLSSSSAEEALDLCQHYEEPIHLVLTDVVMPGASGKEMVEQVIQIRPDLRVLYMSGHTDDTIGQHGILEEGVDLIQKPLTTAALAKKVRQVLDR